MYNLHDYEILEKKFSWVIHIDFLEFVAAKFNLNLAFVWVFDSFVQTINKNLYSLHYV